MQVATGTVKFGPENRVSDRGRAYASVAVSVPGEQQLARVFGPENHPPLMALQPGQEVAIARDSQNRWHLLENAPAAPMGFTAPAAAPHVQHQAPPQYQAAPAVAPAPAADPAIAAADLLARIYGRLIQQGVPEGVAGPMSSTAFIQLNGRGR